MVVGRQRYLLNNLTYLFSFLWIWNKYLSYIFKTFYLYPWGFCYSEILRYGSQHHSSTENFLDYQSINGANFCWLNCKIYEGKDFFKSNKTEKLNHILYWTEEAPDVHKLSQRRAGTVTKEAALITVIGTRLGLLKVGQNIALLLQTSFIYFRLYHVNTI